MAKLQSDSLFLLTDLYQLTMACGYWKCGKAEREAAFHLTFRQNPFGGAFYRRLRARTSYRLLSRLSSE